MERTNDSDAAFFVIVHEIKVAQKSTQIFQPNCNKNDQSVQHCQGQKSAHLLSNLIKQHRYIMLY